MSRQATLSSKPCSGCSHVQDMPLSARIYDCGGCGQIQDSDLNAAINLKEAPVDRVYEASAEFSLWTRLRYRTC